MKKLVAALAAIGALGLANTASAADLPMKAPLMPVAVPYNWTGIYIGATFGGVWGDWSYTNPAAAFNSATNRVSGVLGGPTLGFNWQTGAWVFGVEGDWSWSNAKATDLSGCIAPGCETDYRWFATVRGRVEYAFDHFLLYVTGGGAFARNEQTFLPTGADNGRANIGGWTFGGGVEWAFWQNWSVKAEYLHMDFGDQTIFNPAIALNIVHHDKNLNIARVGLNYRFNWMQ